ncbi:MAG: hypothetical protein J5964_05990 [Eubacterium sp.]|nr:hypothetical protein [Eubacterium sp.]
MKQQKRHRTSFFTAVILIVMTALLIFLGLVLQNHANLEIRFSVLINWLSSVDYAITKLDSNTEILICIFALYIAKCQLPIPMSFLMMISGVVFPMTQAIVINIVFTSFFFTVKYFEGSFIGGGWTGMILGIKKLKFLKEWIEFKGTGNPYVLFVSRLVPSIPPGMVSKYYGSMKYDFIYYICLSILGFSPRIYMYTTIGNAIFNPFSARFITMLIIVVAFTGISVFAFNIFFGIKSKQMNQTLLIYSEKEKYRIVL